MLLVLTAAAFTHADLKTVRKVCQAPATWIWLEGDRLHLTPPHAASYQKVDCLLGEIKKIAIKRGAWPHMGFVGNEHPDPK